MSAESVPDVVVVGGGVIGLSIAYFLSQRGATVTVLDQSQPGQEASWAGAGMLPPGNLERAQDAAARLRAFSHQRWRSFSAELRELTGIDNGYLESAGLELGFSGEGDRLREETEGWISEGVVLERLTPLDLQSLEPALSPEIRHAYRLPGFAQVRNPRHLKALILACELRKVRIVAGAPVMQFDTDMNSSGEGRILAARTANERFPGSQFVIAGGAWTGGLTRQLHVEIPVRPVRGQIVLLSAVPLPFKHILNNGARYLVPRADGRILIGATEEEVGFDKRNTVEGVAGLLQFAQRLVPELARAKLERTWSGLRPGSPNGNPFLSRLPRHANGYVAAGHFRAGLQLSVATGELMAQLITTGTTAISLEEFRVKMS
ncbi:MAG: Glycine oxidase ThiO [Planctomycetaceae bacterium]|nr:Glycine oxidase ThiO [Planctomycetaceae bacterium]